jgi:hypothetical protein
LRCLALDYHTVAAVAMATIFLSVGVAVVFEIVAMDLALARVKRLLSMTIDQFAPVGIREQLAAKQQ